ncbi:MAG TPA: tellurite resistance/C4-dicarboxylate transporter family protein, partial [Burkholderiales bacterium]|nr:tellurite resistance/C4-dicarboxylate transporter family protein [Burkholderiales bacterium]
MPSAPGLAQLSPAYFAMVMATGIVSIAAHLRGLERLAMALFGLNLVAWVVLWLLNLMRMVRYPGRFFGDMADHLRGPGFLTMVAGTSVLGNQLIILADDYREAFGLLALSVLLWIGLTYTIFTAFTIKESKPTLEKGITGGWLLAIVATQSLAVLSALLATHAAAPWKLMLNFFALSMWLWGGMLYIWMMSLIFYRYTFFRFSPGDLAPPYWINMGAMAISTLAGSLLIENTPHAPFLGS